MSQISAEFVLKK